MASKRVALLLLGLMLVASCMDLSMGGSKGAQRRKGRSKSGRAIKRPPNTPLVAFNKFRVEIHNELRMFLLDSHCYSKDDDLGLHVLYPDEQQDWSFKGNWLGTTNFHCRLEWEKGFKEFDAFYYDAEFLTQFCGDSVCVWLARQDGIYLENLDGEPVFTLHWKMLR